MIRMTRRPLAFVTFATLAFVPACAPLQTVQAVDLTRYAGKWYEIAKQPNFFQTQCFGGTTAEYTLLEDGTVRVENRCRVGSLDGPEDMIVGSARVTDPSTNAKLAVSFGAAGLFEGPYWILALDPDYQWAVVGDPSRSTLWILARTPQLDQATYEMIVSMLPELGFDPARLVKTPQPQ